MKSIYKHLPTYLPPPPPPASIISETFALSLSPSLTHTCIYRLINFRKLYWIRIFTHTHMLMDMGWYLFNLMIDKINKESPVAAGASFKGQRQIIEINKINKSKWLDKWWIKIKSKSKARVDGLDEASNKIN